MLLNVCRACKLLFRKVNLSKKTHLIFLRHQFLIEIFSNSPIYLFVQSDKLVSYVDCFSISFVLGTIADFSNPSLTICNPLFLWPLLE